MADLLSIVPKVAIGYIVALYSLHLFYHRFIKTDQVSMGKKDNFFVVDPHFFISIFLHLLCVHRI